MGKSANSSFLGAFIGLSELFKAIWIEDHTYKFQAKWILFSAVIQGAVRQFSKATLNNQNFAYIALYGYFLE